MTAIKRIIKKYFNGFSVISILLLLVSVFIYVLSRFSCGFSDFFNRYISSSIRFVISHITGILPFSLGETVVLCLPVLLFLLIFFYFKKAYHDDVKAAKYVIVLFCCISLMFTSFVWNFGVAYGCTPLEKRLGFSDTSVTKEDLLHTAKRLIDDIDPYIENVQFNGSGMSVMPYSFAELNDRLNDAYAQISNKYDFVPSLRSNVKLLSISPIMTYTHISGIFSYYTAEANICFNYPDYSHPFTMAHEMSHQRGIAPEDECNFMAFLVCMESNDAYIRYSGYLSILEYVLNAYYEADKDGYYDLLYEIDSRLINDMVGSSEFLSAYSNSVAHEVADKVNDTYLKATGEKAGSRSYGLVVDLACAYYKK